MATLTIRRLDRHVIVALKRRARIARCSVQEEARRILAEAIDLDQRAYWERLKRHLDRYGGRQLAGTVELIRAGRSERMRRSLGKRNRGRSSTD